MTTRHATDIELLERYRRDADRSALDTLLTRYYPSVYRTIRNLVHHEADASDLAQATFVKVLEAGARPRAPSRFKSWVLTIAVNEVRQFWRNRQRAPRHDPLFDAYLDSGPSDPARTEFEQQLAQALESFPEKLKLPLVLHYYQSLSLAEVADLLGVAKSTVQSRCRTALTRLRKWFEKRGHYALALRIPDFFPEVAALGARVGVASAVKAAVLVLLLAVTGVFLFTELDAPDSPTVDPGRVRAADSGVKGSASRMDEPASTQGARVEREQPKPKRVVASEGNGVITGQLVQLPDYTPVGGAEVLVSLSFHYKNDYKGPDDDASFVNRYTTDGDGRFVCDELPTSRVFDLYLRKPGIGYRVVKGIGFRTGRTSVDCGVILTTAGVSLTGVVVDESGRGLSGVQVRVGDYLARPSAIPIARPATPLRGSVAKTTADGTFVCAGLSPGFHRVTASTPGRATRALADVRVPFRGTLTIHMHEASSLSGSVVDARGFGIEDAVVEVFHDSGAAYGVTSMRYLTRTKTNERGEFEARDLPSDPDTRVIVNVTAAGYEEGQKTGAVASDDYRFELQKSQPEPAPAPDGELTLHGYVFDQSSRKPVEGAEVSFLGRVCAHTNVAGYYEIAGLEANGRALIGALGFTADGFRPLTPVLKLPDGGTELRKDFELVPLGEGRTIEGSVIDARGAPVPGTVVRLAIIEQSVVERVTVRSGLDGTFRFTQLDPAGVRSGAEVTFSHPQYAFAWTTVEALAKPFVLRGGRDITGIVVDQRGEPVSGARVAVVMTQGNDVPEQPQLGGPLSVAIAGERGTFSFAHLPAVRLALVPYLPGCRVMKPHRDYFVDPRTEQPVRIRLERGRAIAGRVVDENGQPVADVRVRAGRSLALSRADGSFELRGIFTPVAKVTVSGARVQTDSQEVVAGAKNVVLQVRTKRESR